MTGPFVRQHDPDFLPNGNLLVYDNRGGDPACGGSRILEIEPATQKMVWRYDGCGETPFPQPRAGRAGSFCRAATCSSSRQPKVGSWK